MPEQTVPEPVISSTGMPDQPVPETASSSRPTVMPEETDNVAVAMTVGNQRGNPPPPPPPRSLPTDISIPWNLKSVLLFGGVGMTFWQTFYLIRCSGWCDFTDYFKVATSVLWLVCGAFCFCKPTQIMWVFCRLVVPFAAAACSCAVLFLQLSGKKDEQQPAAVFGVMLYFELWYLWLSARHAWMHRDEGKHYVASCMDVICAVAQNTEVQGDMPPAYSEDQGRTVLSDAPPAYSADHGTAVVVDLPPAYSADQDKTNLVPPAY